MNVKININCTEKYIECLEIKNRFIENGKLINTNEYRNLKNNILCNVTLSRQIHFLMIHATKKTVSSKIHIS